jgi:hypothetical protein
MHRSAGLRVPLLCLCSNVATGRPSLRTEFGYLDSDPFANSPRGLVKVDPVHFGPKIEVVARSAATKAPERILAQVRRETAFLASRRFVNRAGTAKLFTASFAGHESDEVQNLSHRDRCADRSKIYVHPRRLSRSHSSCGILTVPTIEKRNPSPRTQCTRLIRPRPFSC